MAKKTDNQRLREKVDAVWSQNIRNRDNRCMLCGKYIGEVKKLEAHHWILTKNQSAKYRWDLRNGVALCHGCHIHQVHRNSSAEMITRLANICIASGIITREEFEEIMEDRHGLIKVNKAYMEDKFEELKKSLNNLKNSA